MMPRAAVPQMHYPSQDPNRMGATTQQSGI